MHNKQALTHEIVNSAVTPVHGERWLSDSKVPGFGLRLWRTKKGQGKALAIRVTTRNGIVVRQTFDHEKSHAFYRSRWEDGQLYQLGDSLVEARQWARDTIATLNGNLTRSEKRWRKWQYALIKIERSTLNQIADELLKEMSARRRSQAYIDSVEKLYSANIRKQLGSTLLTEIDAEDVAKILVNQDLPPGAIRTLKSFINQTLKWAGRIDGSLNRKVDEINEAFWRRWEKEYDVKHPELRDLTKGDYSKIFARLEEEVAYWQQALCIRLFFKLGAPLKRLMGAEWAQIFKGCWYPYYGNQKKMWFESREKLDDQALDLLQRIALQVRCAFGSSTYLFPSRHGRQVGHIRSVDTIWRNTLHDLGFRYYSLQEFARSYRRPNNPSYVGFVVTYYGPMIRRELRADLVARKLRQRRRAKVCSTNYD